MTAEAEARIRARALASAAKAPGASAEIRAAAEMAEAAMQFAELAASNPPDNQPTFGRALNAAAAALSGRPPVERGPDATERATWADQVWRDVLRDLPSLPTN